MEIFCHSSRCCGNFSLKDNSEIIHEEKEVNFFGPLEILSGLISKQKSDIVSSYCLLIYYIKTQVLMMTIL